MRPLSLRFPSAPTRVREELGEVDEAVVRHDRRAAGRPSPVTWVARPSKAGSVVRTCSPDSIVLQADINPGERLVVVSHGVLLTTWLDHVGVLNDPFAFWSDLRTPDAWELDLEEKSLERIV